MKEQFVPHEKVEFKMQEFIEIKNYQQTERVESENIRVWLTNVFVG